MESIFDFTDYKAALKFQVRHLQKQGTAITWKSIAKRIRIQSTFLSKALNSQSAHIGDDHLFSICQYFQLLPEELEYIFLLKNFSVAQNSARKRFLAERIEKVRQKQVVQAPVQEHSFRLLQKESEYLLDPLSFITVISLSLEKYQKTPRLLTSDLGISTDRLMEVLRKIEKLGFIELSENASRVTKLVRKRFHFGTDHPLMRAHQNSMRAMAQAQLYKSREQDRHSFMVTFTGNANDFENVKMKFKAMIKEVENQIQGSKGHSEVYQLNFDFFKWF